MRKEALKTDDTGIHTLAQAFDTPIDPLASVAPVFDSLEVDPFEVYDELVLVPKEYAQETHDQYHFVFEEWQRFMAEHDRHPACPNDAHIVAFIEWQTTPAAEGGPGNCNRTVSEKLRKLNQAYEFWQDHPSFPHPQGYNPITLAKERRPLPGQKTKEHRRIPIPEMRTMIESVPNIRARSVIGLQFKLGLRAGEVSNIRLEDIQSSSMEAIGLLPELGRHERVADYDDVLYIPSRHERKGNKSRRPRLLPIDDELRDLLDRYLLARPANGESSLFLSLLSHTQIDTQGVNSIWKDAFHPDYAETSDHRPVTSHFGRHRFTTYWRVERDLNHQLVQYMRGDRTGAFEDSQGMNAYLHAYYEDIEPIYRSEMYQLGL